jgi:hypothetical protein
MVLIGPSDALDALRAQLQVDAPLQVFTDIQIREAVEFIATHKPEVVAIEQTFAVSPRGEALVGRILEDPSLSQVSIRVVTDPTRDREKPRRKSGAGITPATATPASEPAAAPSVVAPVPMASAPQLSLAFDRRGTRRAERIPMVAGVLVTVDGNPAELIDLSVAGAQVISRIVLRPNQRVRVLLPEGKTDGRQAVRCSALVVWASFEMPSGQTPRYRAGLKLSGSEADAIQDFARLYRKDDGQREKS